MINKIKDILKKYRYFFAILSAYLLIAVYFFCSLAFTYFKDVELFNYMYHPIYGIGVAKLVSYLSPFVFIVFGIIAEISYHALNKRIKKMSTKIIINILFVLFILGIYFLLLQVLVKLAGSYNSSFNGIFFMGGLLLTRDFRKAKNEI